METELEAWDYDEEIKKHEVVELTLDDENLPKDDKLPLPKYF